MSRIPWRRLWGPWCWLAGHDEITFNGQQMCWRCGRPIGRKHGYHALI